MEHHRAELEKLLPWYFEQHDENVEASGLKASGLEAELALAWLKYVKDQREQAPADERRRAMPHKVPLLSLEAGVLHKFAARRELLEA